MGCWDALVAVEISCESVVLKVKLKNRVKCSTDVELHTPLTFCSFPFCGEPKLAHRRGSKASMNEMLGRYLASGMLSALVKAAATFVARRPISVCESCDCVYDD